MPTTLAALGVAVLAVLPGAAYMFAFESRVGAFKVGAPDRIVRFLAASAALHALASGLTYHLYKTEVVTGRLAEGKINPFLIEAAALAYVLVPYGAGWCLGTAYVKDKPWIRRFTRDSWHPRSWDYVFAQERVAYVRLKLKSGPWIAGLYGRLDGQLAAYASGYGEEPDLYLSPSLRVNPETGEFDLDGDERPIHDDAAILVRWNEVEYAHFVYGGGT